MTDEKKTEIKVGITILIALLLFFLIFAWAKNFSVNSNEKLLKVRFNTVAGLEIGDLVTVNGVRKGLVNSISTDNNKAIVEIKFKEKVTLKKDATFSIMMLDLMGGKKITIDAGNSSDKLDFTKIQNGEFAGDVATSMAMLSSVQNDLVDVIKEIKISLKGINKFVGDSTFIDNASSSMKSINHLSTNLNQMIVENRAMLKDIIKNTKQLTGKANDFIDSNNVEIKSSIENLNKTLQSSNDLMVKLNKFSDEITKKENNIGKIIYDEKLIEDIKVSFSEIKKLIKIVNKQLENGGLEVKADIDLF